MNIHDLLIAMGFYMKPITDSNDDFWSSSAGFVIPVVIFICSIVSVYHKAVEDDWFDRLFYCSIAVVMLCAFMLNISNVTDPHHLTESVMYLFCIRMFGQTSERLWKFYKKDKATKIS